MAFEGLEHLLKISIPVLDEVRHLVWKMLEPVLQAMRHAGIGEASVSSRGTLADPAGLEKHDVTPRRLLRREQGGPQPRKTSAHDREIGFLVLRKRRRRLRPLRTIEPVAGGARMFECGEVRVDDVIPCARIAL
jgi:hypothetical protein